MRIPAGFVLLALAGCRDRNDPPAEPGDPEAAAGSGAAADVPAVDVEAPQRGDPARAEPHLARARAAIAGVDVPGARKSLDLALTADPANVDGLELLGWLLLEPGPEMDEGVALLSFEKLRKLGVRTGSALGGAGVARTISGDLDGARPLLEQALGQPDLEKRPDRAARVERALGQVESNAGRIVEAERHFRRAAELEPVPLRRAEPLALLGELLTGADRLEEAESSLRAAVTADPDHLRSRYLHARLLARLGRTDEADRAARIYELLRKLYDHVGSREAQDFERKLRLRLELATLSPETDSFVTAAVRAQLDARRYADAERTIRDVAARRAPTAELAFLLARARAGLGDLDGAGKARQMMRQIDPGVPPHLDRAIAEEWRRGVAGIAPEKVEELVRRWSRG
jgi:tetratricopeptide (TPR) repeat protein